MWYIVLAKDKPGTLVQRLAVRPAHIARLQALAEQGRLKIAGPMPAVDDENLGDAGFVGSMLVVEFSTIQHARAWVNDDPYFNAGVYESADIYPFKPVLP